MESKFNQRLNRTTSVDAINKDIKSNINFVSSYKELPYNEITEVVNAYEVFSEERNESDKYRLVGTVRLMTSNALVDITGQDSLSTLDSTLFRNTDSLESVIDVTDEGDLTFKQSYDHYFREVDGWYSYINPDVTTINKCNRIDFSPKRSDFEIVHSANTNWRFCITYPAGVDTGHTIVNGGLLIVDTGIATIGSIEKLLLVTPVKHNLVAGDKVRITNAGSYSGDYDVRRVGTDTGKLREHAFVIDLSANTINVGTGVSVRMKKVYYGEESTYYFRKFSAITEVNDYELYNLAYSINIYGDKVSQIVFNGGHNNSNELQIGELRDNLNRPISELYFTIIKGKPYGNTIGGRPRRFSALKSGLDIPFIGNVSNFSNVPDIRRIHNVVGHTPATHTPLELDIENTDTYFYGDVVEYNRLYLKEFVLADVNYRFNTINRDSSEMVNLPNTGSYDMGPRPEGYMYKPHHLINIRQFSSYIEQGDSTTYGIPDYATDVGAGRYIWRDLLPLGFNDGGYETALDYPFVNGTHYIHTNILLNVRRQDPFNQYGLYYATFPRDPFGDRINIDNIEENGADYVC